MQTQALTAEQSASVVRVRVIFGGLPPKETIGAIVHYDEISNKALANGKDRFVIASLNGWKKSQLESAEAHFLIYRNKTGEDGQFAAFQYTSNLIRFDPESGLALLRFTDNFEYSADAGFHLDHQGNTPGDLTVLRTSTPPTPIASNQSPATPTPSTPEPQSTPPIPPAFMRPPFPTVGTPRTPQEIAEFQRQSQKQMEEYHEQMRLWMRERASRASANRPQIQTKPAFLIDAGKYVRSSGATPGLQLPAAAQESNPDKTCIALGAPDRLSGFIEQSTEAGVALTSVKGFSMNVEIPLITIKSVSFEESRDRVSIRVQIVTTPAALQPKFVSAYVVDVSQSTSDLPVQGSNDGLFPAIARQFKNSMQYPPNGEITVSLGKAPTDSEKKVLVQLSWPLFDGGYAHSSGCGKPFLARLERRADGLYPHVEGLPDNAGAPAATGFAQKPGVSPASPQQDGPTLETGPVAKFELEAPARNLHAMAGGQEVLFELEGAPYWKIFSFEKKAWLPLPPGDLSNASLTGNLDAVFVLDRVAREVRKYMLPSMQLVSAVKLPASLDYIAILAGCNSSHAPVHILAVDDALALDPNSLQRRDFPVPKVPKGVTSAQYSRNFSRSGFFTNTGDGLCVKSYFRDLNWSFTQNYNSDFRGLENYYLGENPIGVPDQHLGVSRGFAYVNELTCIDTPGKRTSTFKLRPSGLDQPSIENIPENSPIYFGVFRSRQTIPPTPTRIHCTSYFDPAPFAIVDTPELTETSGGPRQPETYCRFLLDPHSFRLGVMTVDRKSWFVHSLVRPQTLPQSVLLNWPVTSFVRGTEFRFKPIILGGDKFTADLYKKPGKAEVNSDDGTVRIRNPADEPASLQLLTLKLPGANGAELSYPIALHATAPALPLIIKPMAPFEYINLLGAAYRVLEMPGPEARALPETSIRFEDQVAEILGPIGGYVALVTAANRVDFLSLESRKVIKSIAVSPGANFYAGAGALFEYDAGKRTFTRIGVPDGRLESFTTLPPGVGVSAIAIGTDAGSPVTLALTVTQGQESIRFSDVVITATAYRTSLAVLDGETLRAAGWKQPESLERMLKQPEPANPFGIVLPPNKKPPALPASHNGCVVTLPMRLVILSPTYSVHLPFSTPDTQSLLWPWGFAPTGSISGLNATAASGQIFRGGVKLPGGGGETLGASPCGRYRLVRTPGQEKDRCLEIRAADTDTPLMLVPRLANFEDDLITPQNLRIRRIFLLGDEGPLAVLSPDGKSLQLVDFNIPLLAKSLAPDEFHVTSQPIPCVVADGTLQYQIKVNNPETVKTYRLRSPVSGATLSPAGLLQYTAPGNISGPTQTNNAIEIEAKNGNVVLHEFPIFILPRPPATPRSGPGPI